MCHAKWTFLLQLDWSKVKGLYIVTRYLPFIYLITVQWNYFTQNEPNQGTCRILTNVTSGLGIALVSFSECASHSPVKFFFILRTYVLWNKNRIMLAAMLSTFFMHQPGFSHDATNLISGVTDCYLYPTNSRFFVTFILLTVFELELAVELKPFIRCLGET
ncbi:hypothetical protein BDR07DRAFT_1528994 [Suillus spraguei]|nr:hypothetical protein BDR07DRAFT_1528994 [Suillus spraguei]